MYSGAGEYKNDDLNDAFWFSKNLFDSEKGFLRALALSNGP